MTNKLLGSVLGILALAPVAVSATALTPSAHATTYVVVYKSGTSATDAANLIAAAGGTVIADYPEIGVTVANAEQATFPSAIKRLIPGVKGVAPTDDDRPFQYDWDTLTGDDVETPAANHKVSQWNMKQISADKAQQLSQGTKDVLVGVLDTGIDFAHPTVANNIDARSSASCLTGKPDTSSQSRNPTSKHGTKVASVIAGANTNAAIVGVAPNVRLAAITVGDRHGWISAHAAICGYMWAAQRGVDVANASMSVDPWKPGTKQSADMRAVWDGVERAVLYSQRHNVLNVVALGNDNYEFPLVRSHRSARSLPQEVFGVIGVSALDHQRTLASYSSYGFGVTSLAAPGGDGDKWRVLAAATGGIANNFGGTSAAAAHVSGVAALVKSVFPKLSPTELAERLKRTADPLPCPTVSGSEKPHCEGPPEHNSFYGYGEVNAWRALRS